MSDDFSPDRLKLLWTELLPILESLFKESSDIYFISLLGVGRPDQIRYLGKSSLIPPNIYSKLFYTSRLTPIKRYEFPQTFLLFLNYLITSILLNKFK